MNKRKNAPNQQGFTLLELIVAVSILALIAVFSWRGLDAVVQTRDSLTLAQTRIDDLQRGFNRIERDALLARDIRRIDNGLRLIAANGAVVEYRLDQGSLWRRVINAGTGAADEEQRLVDEAGGWKLEVFRRNPDGVTGWTAVPAELADAAPVPVIHSTPDGPLATFPASAPATAASSPVSTLPATRFAVPALPGFSPGSPGSAPQNPAFNPAGETPLQLNHLSGLRITLTLAQGGTVQRLFLLGSGA